MQVRMHRPKPSNCSQQFVDAFVSFGRGPATDGENHSPYWIRGWQRKPGRIDCHLKKVRIERPGKPANSFRRDALHFDEFLDSVVTGGKDAVGGAKGGATVWRQGLPYLHAMSHHNRPEMR